MSSAQKSRGGRPAGSGRQEDLLRTVIRIVARDGLDALSFRSLAEEAKSSYGLAAYHFGSREEMLDAALLLCVRDHQEQVDATFAVATLEEFAADIPQLVIDLGDTARFQFTMLLASRRNPGMKRSVEDSYDSFTASIKTALEGIGVPASPDMAALVLAAIDGIVLRQFVYEDPAATHRILAELRVLLRELRGREP